MVLMRSQWMLALLMLVTVALVAGQRADQDDVTLTVRPQVTKPGSKGPIKKVVKINRLLSKTSITNAATATAFPSLSTGGSISETRVPNTTPAAPARAIRQNTQPLAAKRVLRGSPVDNQSQASSPKHTFAFNEQDDEYFSRRRARFLFRSRVGK